MIEELDTDEAVNATPSMPLGAYQRMAGMPIERGSIVLVRARDVLERRYIACLGLADALFVKRVAGMPGDQVSAHDDVVYVNGAPVTRRYLHDEWKAQPINQRTREAMGKSLPYWPGHAQVIKPGWVFLLCDGSPGFDVRDSLDGRYLAPIPQNLLQPDPWQYVGAVNDG